MGRAKFTKRDRNRFRKTYPYMRTRPVMEYMAGKETIMETGAADFDGDVSVTHNWISSFPIPPTVSLTAYDDSGLEASGVNVYIQDVTTEKVTIGVSEAFTGTVHIQAMYIREGAS
tara:strand:+ start:1431 stop:1778 length:348 start_codon:yes stop_codon:yes gene_type:complete